MKARVNDKEVSFDLLQIADMNYGQMQRWWDFLPLKYEIEIDIETFLKKVGDFFSEFRREEMEEDDVTEFPELATYKAIGWPELASLLSDNVDVLKGLFRFIDYDLIDRLVVYPVPKSDYYFSINSLDTLCVVGNDMKLSGICFKSDYIEHTYNHELPRKHALLKPNS